MRFFRFPRVDNPLTLSDCCGSLGHDVDGVAHCSECWVAAPGTSVPAPAPCDECFEIDGHTPACGW